MLPCWSRPIRFPRNRRMFAAVIDLETTQLTASTAPCHRLLSRPLQPLDIYMHHLAPAPALAPFLTTRSFAPAFKRPSHHAPSTSHPAPVETTSARLLRVHP